MLRVKQKTAKSSLLQFYMSLPSLTIAYIPLSPQHKGIHRNLYIYYIQYIRFRGALIQPNVPDLDIINIYIHFTIMFT